MSPKFHHSLIIFLLASIPLIFLGYGSDNDTYGVLSAGISTWENGIPQMSRHPGYWLYEALVFGLSKTGGYILVNGVTLIAAVFVLYRFHAFAIREGLSNITLLNLCLALNPWFLIAATSTMDYIWALLFIVLAIELALSERYLLAGLSSGLAAGFRLGSVFTLAFSFISSMIKDGLSKKLKGYFLLGTITTTLIVMFYVPSWLHKGQTFTFLEGHLGEAELWTLKMHAGRFFYKTIYLFSLPNAVVIAFVIVLKVFSRDKRLVTTKGAIAAFGACLGTLFLYARYPIEIAYLLPFLFFFLLLLGMHLGEKGRSYLAVLLASTVFYSFVDIPVAKPNVPGQASDAAIGLSIEPGVLLRDIFARVKLRSCAEMKCYVASQ